MFYWILPANDSYRNLVIFVRVRTQKTWKKSHFMAAELVRKTLKIYNFTNAVMIKLTTIMYFNTVFHLAKFLGVSHRVSESVNKIFSKSTHNISFLPQFLAFFQTKRKTVTYLINYHKLHNCSKFERNLTTFGEVLVKNHPKVA